MQPNTVGGNQFNICNCDYSLHKRESLGASETEFLSQNWETSSRITDGQRDGHG